MINTLLLVLILLGRSCCRLMTFAGDFDWQEIRAAAHHRRLSHKEKIYWAGRERHHFNHFFF
jgi:hypothetical protein